jgi:hypothetical protein
MLRLNLRDCHTGMPNLVISDSCHRLTEIGEMYGPQQSAFVESLVSLTGIKPFGPFRKTFSCHVMWPVQIY